MMRLTVNKSKDEMSMVELAHNCCFVEDGKAMYRDYDAIIDARKFVRNLIRAKKIIDLDDEIFTDDSELDEFMTECLGINPDDSTGLGLIALLYKNLWAQADLYERLRNYEDLQEQLEKVYGDCDGMLETVVEGLVKHDGADIENPVKARLLIDSTAEKWLKWKTADEHGRLLELPCAVGDTVWDNDWGTPCDYEVTGLSFGNLNEDYCEDEITVFDQVIVYYANSSGSITGSFAVSEIGKTVFLSREEAEKALEGKAE